MTHASQHSHELALMAVTKWTETNLSLVSPSGALANAESFGTEIAKVYKAALLELGISKDLTLANELEGSGLRK